MTRFARGGTANKKKPHESTPWSELKSSSKEDSGGDHTSKLKHKKDDRRNRQSGHFKKKAKKFRNFTQISAAEQYKRRKDKSEKRRLKRIDKRESAKVCFNCREEGHMLSDCPQLSKSEGQGTGICFKCGSTEHTSSSCKAKIAPGSYPFAKCFICGEMGHISKKCPDNPRGLYPNGGCCKECGSVEHFRKDCPELQKQQGIEDVKIQKLQKYANVEEDVMTVQQKTPPVKKKKGPKLVKF